MSGVYYHIVAFACEKDASACFAPALFPAFWLADSASALHCCKAPLLGVHEPIQGYSQRAQYVKRLLLAALARETNRGGEPQNERE